MGKRININDYLPQIERLAGLKYPKVFTEAAACGLMDYGVPDRHCRERTFPALREHPPLLLYAKDFEPISLDVAVEKLKDFADPTFHMGDYTQFGLLPFAESGAGDVYCFLYKAPIDLGCGKHTEVPSDGGRNEVPSDGGRNEIPNNGGCNDCADTEPPVVMVYHDAPEIDVLANNFQDFVFAQILGSVSGFFATDRIATGNLDDNIMNMLRSHRPVLTERQHQVLDDIFRRRIVEFHRTTIKMPEPWELISADDTEALLEREIGFPYRKYTFFVE